MNGLGLVLQANQSTNLARVTCGGYCLVQLTVDSCYGLHSNKIPFEATSCALEIALWILDYY